MSDLDDFFAKKDRKKSKSTKKFSTTDEVAKKLEDNAKKSEKMKKERQQPEGDETTPTTNDQDEWKDFEEEKKDYSGLKIGNLTISSPVDDNGDSIETNSEQQEGSDGNMQENDKKMGPWRRVDVEVQEEKPVVVEKKIETEKVPPKTSGGGGGGGAGGAYVPPSLRNQPQTTHVQSSRLRGKTAPDIHNKEFFPTLSKTTNEPRKNRNEASFEVVQHNKAGSHRSVEQAKLSTGQGPKLSLENRYNTLSDS